MDILGGISEVLADAPPSKAQLEDGWVWFKCADDRILLQEDECEVAPWPWLGISQNMSTKGADSMFRVFGGLEISLKAWVTAMMLIELWVIPRIW